MEKDESFPLIMKLLVEQTFSESGETKGKSVTDLVKSKSLDHFKIPNNY
jgi:hypothetical protein